MTYQLSATVDDPPLYARGNAGTPRLQWATAVMGASSFTGPTLVYSKNAPWGEGLDYTTALGTSQVLFNEEEDFDLFLAQVGTEPPTAVTLTRFAATVRHGRVVIEWETAAEINTLGFDVYRQDPRGGERVRVNARLVPASLDPAVGGIYRLTDPGARPGGTAVYMLQEIDAGGQTTAYGPFRIQPVAGQVTMPAGRAR
jgi:hypothetical protein